MCLHIDDGPRNPWHFFPCILRIAVSGIAARDRALLWAGNNRAGLKNHEITPSQEIFYLEWEGSASQSEASTKRAYIIKRGRKKGIRNVL